MQKKKKTTIISNNDGPRDKRQRQKKIFNSQNTNQIELVFSFEIVQLTFIQFTFRLITYTQPYANDG